MSKWLKRIGLTLLILLGLIILAGFILKSRMDAEPLEARAIENPVAFDATVTLDQDFTPNSIDYSVPVQPGLAGLDRALMHSDTYQSDTHSGRGVLSETVSVAIRRAGGSAPRQCATFTFLSGGEVLALCGGLTSFRLTLIDPETLELLAYHDLPMRPSAFEATVKRDPNIIFGDTSGGAYFYLDDQDRAVVADARQFINWVRPEKTDRGWDMIVDRRIDMRAYVPNDCYHYDNLRPKGECDALTTVMPVGDGQHVWWATRNGRFGVLNMETEAVTQAALGEEIQNSFAVDGPEAFIVSDHAMYRHQFVGGEIREVWRLPYDRGTGRKVGSINQGSGTSPTLMGNRWVTFTDNADGRINLIIADRETGAQFCSVPLFADGASATDNSMIATESFVIIENNSGYSNTYTQTDYGPVVGGVTRVDVTDEGCETAWESDLKVPSVVPKLSLATGVAYFYSFEPASDGERVWSLVGLDARTGAEVIRVPVGTGKGHNNNWASIAIAPNGDLWVGLRRGLARLREE